MLENDVSDLRIIRDRSFCIQDMFVSSTERFSSDNIVSSSSSSKNFTCLQMQRFLSHLHTSDRS